MHKVAIVQARMGSSRFPKKVLELIQGKTMIERVMEKLSASSLLDQIVIATTDQVSDQALVDYCKKNKISYFTGSEDDVLTRYYEAAKAFHADVVVRVTSDCPLFDGKLLDEGLKKFMEGGYDYVTNVLPPTFPDGLDYSILKFSVLEDAFHEASLSSEREHVVPWIWKNCTLEQGTRYQAFNLSTDQNLSDLRWTVDYPADLQLIDQIYAHFAGASFSWKDTVQFSLDHPEALKANQSITRDEGYLKSIANDTLVKGREKP